MLCLLVVGPLLFQCFDKFRVLRILRFFFSYKLALLIKFLDICHVGDGLLNLDL